MIRGSEDEGICLARVMKHLDNVVQFPKAEYIVFIVQTFEFPVFTLKIVKPTVIYHQFYLGTEYILCLLIDYSKKKRVLKNMKQALANFELY